MFSTWTCLFSWSTAPECRITKRPKQPDKSVCQSAGSHYMLLSKDRRLTSSQPSMLGKIHTLISSGCITFCLPFFVFFNLSFDHLYIIYPPNMLQSKLLLLMSRYNDDMNRTQGVTDAVLFPRSCLVRWCVSAAGELQKDGKADWRWPQAVQWASHLLPGESQDRKALRSSAEWLGQEVEGCCGERLV